MTPEAMRLRRSTVEHPFATIKYRIFGHPRLLLRGLSGAYNLKRITNVLGAAKFDKSASPSLTVCGFKTQRFPDLASLA